MVLVGFICARVSEDPADLTSPDRFKLCVLFGGPAIEHIQCFVAHAFIDRWEVHRRYEANFLVAPSPKRQFEQSAHTFPHWDVGIDGIGENEGARKSTSLNSSQECETRMTASA